MDTELALPELLIELNNKNEQRRTSALVIARKLSSEQLLELAKMEARDYRQRYCIGVIFAGAITTLMVLEFLIPFFESRLNVPNELWFLIVCITMYMKDFIPNRGRKSVVNLIADTDDINLLGACISNLGKTEDGEARGLCIVTLNRLLPKIHESDGSKISPKQMNFLIQYLRNPNKDPGLTISILKAFEQVGDKNAIPFVERLTHCSAAKPTKFDLRIQMAALECLPYLLQNAERQKVSSTLLRPSSEPANPDTLLRPNFPHQLLKQIIISFYGLNLLNNSFSSL